MRPKGEISKVISPTTAVIVGLIIIIIFAAFTGIFSYLIGQPVWNITIGPFRPTPELVGSVIAGVIIIFVIVIFIIAFITAFRPGE